ncbi:MAG: hypothetical protein OXB86_03315, partial [Bdellovibrionales bacterium]|nr:hypothetical protein [Bdellovibrionales bacterium]
AAKKNSPPQNQQSKPTAQSAKKNIPPQNQQPKPTAQAAKKNSPPQNPQKNPAISGNPLEGLKSAPPTRKISSTIPPSHPAPGKNPHNTPSSQPMENIPGLSPSPENLHGALPPLHQPSSSPNRHPQNVLKKPAEIFDYSAKIIIFYRPCKNQSSSCRRPLMTNRKDIMFKYDKNRNINISGIANNNESETKVNPPDTTKNKQIN